MKRAGKKSSPALPLASGTVTSQCVNLCFWLGWDRFCCVSRGRDRHVVMGDNASDAPSKSPVKTKKKKKDLALILLFSRRWPRQEKARDKLDQVRVNKIGVSALQFRPVCLMPRGRSTYQKTLTGP